MDPGTLGSLGEFGWLRRARSWMAPGQAHTGPGDDAAVLPVEPGANLVATTDVLIEETHFRQDWSSPADIGYRSIAVNVSDIAAMAARPRWALIGLGAPPETTALFLEELYAGFADAHRLYDVVVAGGDTVRSDRLLIAVTLLGETIGAPLLRSGAVPGDVLCVTGPLGRAGTGVNLLLAGAGSVADIPDDEAACITAHRRPVARVEEGRLLRDAGAHAGMDLSDGLASDAHRLAEESGVGIVIDGDALPVSSQARAVCERRGWDAARLALTGGEDYELLVAVPAGLRVEGVDLLPVGRVTSDHGVFLESGGERRPMPEGGWDHFRGGL